LPLGFYLGNAGPTFNIREYTAARPLSDTELADAILWNTARSVGWSWLIWWIGVAFCFSYAAWVGAAPQSPAEVFPNLRSDSWAQVAFYVVAAMAGSLVVSWTLASISVSWILVRQWMFHTILLIASGIPVTLSICAILEVAPETWDWIQGGLIGLLSVLNLAVYVAAYWRRQIGWRRISTVCALAAVLYIFTALSVPQLPEIHRTWALAWLFAISPLPFLAFATAPLALSWNRHR
jgi:hypothetical protein